MFKRHSGIFFNTHRRGKKKLEAVKRKANKRDNKKMENVEDGKEQKRAVKKNQEDDRVKIKMKMETGKGK